MSKYIVIIVSAWIVCSAPRPAFPADCYSDMVVRGWMDERDRAEKNVVQAWSRGCPVENLASDIAVILANELYLCSTCRDQGDFLKQNLHVLNKGLAPEINMVPAMILEVLLGQDLLSPSRQFPSERKKEVKKVW